MLRRTAPALLSKQQQPKLTQTQVEEARTLLAAGWSLRMVGKHFIVSHGAIWRLVQRDRAAEHAQQPDEQTAATEPTEAGMD